MDTTDLIAEMQATMYELAVSGMDLKQNYNIPDDVLEAHERLVIRTQKLHRTVLNETEVRPTTLDKVKSIFAR